MTNPDWDDKIRRMEPLGKLAGGVAHDFNNCLTVILGYSELLIDMLPDGDSTRTIIEDIAEAARRGTRLTRELILFSGCQPVRPQRVSILEQLTALSCRLRHMMPETIAVRVNASDRSLQVMGDPDQLAHMLINLAMHARDGMRLGGTLHIEACGRQMPPMIDVLRADARSGKYVLIRIQDTGEGMDPVTREHVFEPLFTTKKGGRGAGLRMGAVFGIVKTFGGFITVQSREEQGSTFDVYLPEAGDGDAPSPGPCIAAEDSASVVD